MPPFPFRCRISSEKWGQRIRCFTRNSQGLEDPAAPVYWSRAVAYLQTHYQDPTLTTAQLAQELYASREHLSRAFKECTMESIHNYLIYLRMQHCRKALEGGRFRPECLHRKRLSGLQQLPEKPSAVCTASPLPHTAHSTGQWCVKSCGRRIRKFFSKRVDILPALWYYT